jgi:hypothetical protein
MRCLEKCLREKSITGGAPGTAASSATTDRQRFDLTCCLVDVTCFVVNESQLCILYGRVTIVEFHSIGKKSEVREYQSAMVLEKYSLSC